MKIKTLFIIFCLLVLFSSFSQENVKKKILILNIDNQEDILTHIKDINECKDIFYIKELSETSSLYGFRTKDKKTKASKPVENIKSFKDVFNKIKGNSSGRVDFIKYFSKFYVILVEKDRESDSYNYYDVSVFVETI